MRLRAYALLFSIAGFVAGGAFFIAASIVFAWVGPSSAPPAGNVDAPINVGTTDQIKNSGLSVNALAVFGNAILSGTARYLNFGTVAGSAGYGIRDNVGNMEIKDSGSASPRWEALRNSCMAAPIRARSARPREGKSVRPARHFSASSTVPPVPPDGRASAVMARRIRGRAALLRAVVPLTLIRSPIRLTKHVSPVDRPL